MRIRLRPIRRPGANVSEVMRLVKTTEDKRLVASLLQRYGVSRVVQLHPEEAVRFLEELNAIMKGEAQHPDLSSYYNKENKL